MNPAIRQKLAIGKIVKKQKFLLKEGIKWAQNLESLWAYF